MGCSWRRGGKDDRNLTAEVTVASYQSAVVRAEGRPQSPFRALVPFQHAAQEVVSSRVTAIPTADSELAAVTSALSLATDG